MASSEWIAWEEFNDGTPYDPPSWAIGISGEREVATGLSESDAEHIIATQARAARLEEALREGADVASWLDETSGAPARIVKRCHAFLDLVDSLLSSPDTTQRRGEG